MTMDPGKGEGRYATHKHPNLVSSSQGKAFTGHEQASPQEVISKQPGTHLGVTPVATQQAHHEGGLASNRLSPV